MGPVGRGLAAAAVLASSALSGCTGRIGDIGGEGNGLPGSGRGAPGEPGNAPGDGGGPSPAPSTSGPVTFTCDRAAAFTTPAMRRLTKRQYENTLRDLVTGRVGADDARAVLDAVAPAIGAVPDEVRKQVAEDLHGSYRRLDQDVAQGHVDAWYQVATELGTALTTPARLGRVVGTCATDTDPASDVACVGDFIRTFGEKAFRRPLTDTDLERVRAYYGQSAGIDPLGLADVIGGILSAPEFLYLVEHGGEERTDLPGTFRLTPFELASRLSYHFWETAPDSELFDAARNGSLLEQDEYQRQVDRLFHDPRTRETLREFVRDWLKLEDLSDLTRNAGQPIYRAFAGTALPGPELRGRMIDEVLDLVDYFTWQTPGTIEDLFTTEFSFAKTADVAGIYGTTPWDGAGTPPSLPAGERPGVLGRAALLATGTAMTRPIMRGVFMRRTLLCDDIPPPPDNAAAKPPELSDTLSTRQVVEALTQKPGTACQGCHGAYINPLGFAFEGFDALGRVRSEQTLFDMDGNVTGAVAVDSRTVPKVNTTDPDASEGPADVVRLMLATGKPQACLARHYFRFSFGRWEDLESDGCVLESIRQSLTSPGGLASLLQNVATTDAFRERTFD